MKPFAPRKPERVPLARDLGATPMSAHYHVTDKEQILDGIVDPVFVQAIAPRGARLGRVHTADVDMATTANCTDEQRAVFFDAGRALVEDEGADAVLLAGTDLALAFSGYSPGFPVFDCAQARVGAIAEQAQRR